MAIEDEEYWMRPVVKQPFQEFNKDFAVEFAFDQHESHGSLWRDGRYHVAMEAGSRGGNDRGFASNRPGPPRMEVGAYPSLVSEEDIRLLFLRHSPNLRIFHLDPLLDPFRILLKCTPQWPLRTEPKLIQEPTHRCLAQTNVELSPNQFPDHDARPQRKRKLHLPGISLRYRIIDPLHHLAGQLWRTTTALASIQRIPSPLAVAGQPPKQSRFLYAQYLRYQRYRLSILNRGYPPLPQFRQLLVCQPPRIVVSHTSTVAD